MNGRERVDAALNHRESDRVPRDLGGTESSGMTVKAYENLQQVLGINAVPRVFEPYQYVAYIDHEVRQRYRIDTVNLTPEPVKWQSRQSGWGSKVELPDAWHEVRETDGSTVVVNAAGRTVAVRPEGGTYFDPVNPLFECVTSPDELVAGKAVIHGFDWPSFADEPVSALNERAQRMHESGECVVFNLCCHLLAAGQLLRGYENFMIDLMTDEPMCRTLLDLLLEGYLERIERLAPALKDKVDVILFNDDLGTQQGPMLSPELYRSAIKPYQRQLFAAAKGAFGKPILFHSCGAVRDFIPDLIEVGVDALNPVQVSAVGMDIEELKREFGDVLTFWGGGVDTQQVLNHGSAEEVKNAVKRSVDCLAPGGGFVFCQVHNVQPDVPPANVEAMYQALDEIGG